MALNGLFWSFCGITFLIFALFALKYPDSYSKNEIALAFAAIGFFSLSMVYYWVDKSHHSKRDDETDERLKRIEEMVKKWDFD